MDINMVGPWILELRMLSTQYELDHVRHNGWVMDALRSKTDPALNATMLVPCCPLKTD